MDSDFIRELRTFGIAEIMQRNGYVPLFSKAVQWNCLRQTIRKMIHDGQIKKYEHVKVGQDIYLKKDLEKPTKNHARWTKGFGK